MEQVANPEIKIDKRTKEYKDSLNEPTVRLDVPPFEPAEALPVEIKQSCHKCGKLEDLVVISPEVSICRSCLDSLQPTKVEDKVVSPKKRRKRKSRDFSHLKCGSMVDGVWVNDFSKCMHCGELLETSEDGTPRHYKYPTPCEDCVFENYTTAVINGKEVEINPSDPPKLHFEDDGRGNEYTELKDSKGRVY